MSRTELLKKYLLVATENGWSRRPAAEWAKLVGCSTGHAYHVIKSLGVKDKVLLVKRTPLSGGINLTIVKHGSGKLRRLTIGSGILLAAGFQNRERLRYRVVAGRITIEAGVKNSTEKGKL